MVEVLAVVLFLLSFVLILKGGGMLVESAIYISHKAKIPPMIVGATVVSLATTLPETCVSLLAVRSGDMQLASGNALGSMICNFALILGIAFTAMPSSVDRSGFKSKCIFLVINLALLTIFAINGRFSIVEGSILLVLLVLFLFTNALEAKRAKEEITLPIKEQSTVKVALEFIIGALAIGYGSHVLVSNSQTIGSVFGVNQKFLALTIVAIGTGLPEVVTTITSIKQKNAGIGVGNMIGANIINGSMLMGLCSVLSQGKLTIGSSAFLTFLVLFLVYIVAIIPTLIRGKSSRVQGILLLSIYLAYVVYLFFV